MDGDTPAVAPAAPASPEPAAPAAPVAPVAPVAPAAPAEAAPWDWGKAPGIDPDKLGYVQAKGWKDPGSVIESYRHAEKMLGVPADQVIKIPKERTDATMAEVYDKLGRPKDASGYSITVPEVGGDPELAKEAAGWFHEAGLNQSQVERITTKWNAKIEAVVKAQTDAVAARDAAQVAKLKTDWGPQMQANTVLVDRAAQAFGMTPEQVAALRQVMGPGDAMRFLHKIGSKLGVDDTFVNGGGVPPGFGGMTPEQAKARIVALKNDKGWVQRFTNGDVEVRAESTKLHQIAFPPQ